MLAGRGCPLATAGGRSRSSRRHSLIARHAPAMSPLAWSGRPSELPAERVRGPAAVFVVPGTGGPRLVYVEPILHQGPPIRRAGTIAAEQVIDTEGAEPRPGDAEAQIATTL